jgi:hypothetical protein
MSLLEFEIDNGMFGFGGRATVKFVTDGRLILAGKTEPLALRVELSRRMNLMEWEALSVSHEP